ncbi:unnamed protein product [Brachionus calyciflorus]|uniref:Abnormal spindle-like microcephaly-associated protein ASH domain-containing protein n=1 Tax=Brachionus calyciflorus TaxID=104777 RepID=A0A813X3A0_9BILA|nr:unnamed protein product [Brachionus calyciflorus]
MTDCVANSHGLVFSISPVKKQPKKKNQEEEEENILTLAPFTKPPKINFGQLKINESVERAVLLINPQQFDLDLVVTNNELNINNIQLKIEKGRNVNLKIVWTPEKPGNYKFAILFEVTNSARLKFLVHAFGICIKPEEKKPIRKPLNMLQPLKKEKKLEPAPPPVQKKETTISTSTKYKTTTTTTTTIFKKTGKKSSFDETVIIEKNREENKENKKNLGITIESISEAKQPEPEFKNPRNIYEDSFSEDVPLENTPKLTDYQTNREQGVKVQLTPKLSDFMKPSVFDVEQLNSFSTTSTTTLTKITKIAATQLIDIGIDQENPINNKTLVNIAQGPKTPHFPFKFNSYLGESIPYPDQNSPFTSTVNRLGFNQQPYLGVTPKFDRNFLYKDETDMKLEDDVKLEKCVILCQKVWRYKIFRRKLRELKEKNKLDKLNQLLAVSKNVAKEFELINKRQDELVSQQMLEKQRNEQLIAEMERLELEKKERFLRCVLICQRAIRMKRFRQFLKEHREKLILKGVLLVQRKWRMIKFRSCLRQLKIEEQLRIEHETNVLKYTAMCQKMIRYKNFKRNLNSLRQAKRILDAQNSAASLIQKNWRMYKFRCKMTKYRQSAISIQNWYRNRIKPRNDFLTLKKTVVRIQNNFRKKMILKNQSSLKIQIIWRGYVQRKAFLRLKNSTLKIQRWFRDMKDRLCFLKLKRSLPSVQSKCRKLIQKQNKAALTIQHSYFYYKFRESMNLYRTAAIKIQTWTRSMKLRYEYLENRRIIIKSVIVIQKYCRMYIARKQLGILRHKKLEENSAVIIQKLWRGRKVRQDLNTIKQERLEQIKIRLEMEKLNKYATIIQSVWRGFIVRKETTQVLCSIRSRLSFYKFNTSSETNPTLGVRIKNSLKILNFQCVPIQQIILALTDLDKVTRLSPECCLIFTREGAIQILYEFIMNCNRSVPHMDLVKLCLQILINLSKYSQTAEYLLRPAGSCLLLLNLIQAYQSSNPNIFMDACIIFILLAQNESIKKVILKHENFIKKITGIYSVLERRANFSRDRQTSKGCLNSKEQLNSTLNVGLSSSSKKSLVLSFSPAPEWSLAKRETIELVDPIGAIEYMMNSLNITSQVTSGMPTSGKTPKKSLSSSSIDKSGKKSAAKVKPQAKQAGAKTSTKQLFKDNGRSESEIITKYKMEEETPVYCETEYDDDHFSITSNESYRSVSSVTTVKSISNLNAELPKLNSTLIGSNKRSGLKKSESVNFP